MRYNAGTASSWTLTANCTVSGAYSFLNRYNCQLVQVWSAMSLSVGGGRVGTLVLACIITIFGYTNNVWLILFFSFLFPVIPLRPII